MKGASLTAILIALLFVVIAMAFILGILVKTASMVMIGIIVPIVIFMAVYFLVNGLKKKILLSLKRSFGENVVKIAGAIMEYFEVPLTIILSVSITLFVIALSGLFIVIPLID